MHHALTALALAGTLTSCGTLAGGRAWGQDATLLPGWGRVGQAAADAFSDPMTWVPLAGAGLLMIEDLDEEIAEWAARETPVFGSQGKADTYSTDARQVLQKLSLVSALATQGGDEPATWVLSKLQGLGVREISTQSRKYATDRFKVAFERPRPDHSEARSFPSGHTSGAFNYARWVIEDLDSIAIPQAARDAVMVGSWAGAVSVGWARVEANRHYPVDVLAGAALGNFTTLFARKAFLGLPEPDEPTLHLDVAPEHVMIGLRWSF